MKEKLATFKLYKPTQIGLRNPVRAFHATICDEHNNLFLFGGSPQKKEYSNTFYRYDWDKRTWLTMDTLGDEPSPRGMFSYTYAQGELWIFGGRSYQGIEDDLFSFNFETRTWTEHKCSLSPEPRILASFSYCESLNALILFGGSYGAQKAFNDVWLYSLDDNTWELMETVGKKPAPTTGHTAHVMKSELIIFGGWTMITQDHQESNNENTPITTSNKIRVLNLNSRTWDTTVKTNGPVVQGRACHASAASHNGEDMWIIGGSSVDLDDFALTELLYRFNVPERRWYRYEVHGMINEEDKLFAIQGSKGLSLSMTQPVEDSDIHQMMLYGGHDEEGRFSRHVVRIKTDIIPKPKKKRKLSLHVNIFKRKESDYDEQVFSDPESPMSPFPLSPM
eukprot:gb/GECH01000427.1/.p1 GENE.gb/GECH01000427.1/~~gb/GECH01000427.1/.p1  ORF type:complete len:393 (+),score=95.76 gb/GECH01000427.1/:1-1179(+)